MESFTVVIAVVVVLALIVSIWQRAEMSHALETLRKDVANLDLLGIRSEGMASVCHHEWGVLKEESLQNDQEQKTITILQCKFCGNLDKTIESVRVPEPPQPVLPRSECRHKWEKQKTVELESAYEQMKGFLESCETFQPWMFRKSVVIQRICTCCGEISTIESSNYDLNDLPNGSGEVKPYRKPKETRSSR